MKRTSMVWSMIAGVMAPLSTVRAHEGYHTVFTHLDPAATAFIVCLAAGVPLIVLAVRRRNRPFPTNAAPRCAPARPKGVRARRRAALR